MKKVFLSFSVLAVVFFTACGEDKKNKDEQNDVKNNVNVSNCLDFAVGEKYGSLDPINVTDVTSFHITSQIFESLLKFNEKNLELEPLIAESWEVADDNLTHTFKIKKGVFFHDDTCFDKGKGRELKASDVVYTFTRILSEESYANYLFKDILSNNAEGIKAVDDYTVTFTLSKPSPNFLNLLATISSAIVAKEAVESNVVVGTGPFTYQKDQDQDQAITLSKNNNYHIKGTNGESLPYLECVAFNYINDGQEQLDKFLKGELDIITGLPSKSIKEIVETQIADFQNEPVKYVLGRYPQTATTYITLNTGIEPFNNVKVRKAIAMAINKEKIVNDILKGEAAAPGNHGMVSPAINDYDYSSIVGLSFDIAKAKQLLKEAGFENGNGLPSLILATGNGNTSVRVGLEIQKQLRANLGVNVELSSMPLSERKKSNAESKNHMSIDGWLAEIPEPVSFLSLFYGAVVPENTGENSFPNESRFKNESFDNLYEKAMVTLDKKERYELCLQADQIIANEAPAIPLWYHEDYHLIQSSITGYYPNAMNLQYLAHAKIEVKKEEKKSEE